MRLPNAARRRSNATPNEVPHDSRIALLDLVGALHWGHRRDDAEGVARKGAVVSAETCAKCIGTGTLRSRFCDVCDGRGYVDTSLERYEAQTGYGATVVYERDKETGETIATFENGNKYKAIVPDVPEFTGHSSNWLRAALIDKDGMNWRRFCAVERNGAK